MAYAGTAAPASVTVQANDSAAAAVAYAATSTAPGTLNVEVGGLPVGVDADVAVTGPATSESITSGTVLTDVDPGVYEVTAEPVSDGPDSYAPQVSGSPATVPAGGEATVTVKYVLLDPAEFGALHVEVTGLPVGVDADVSVTGVGNAYDETVTASTTLNGLVPGFYDVSAAEVTDDLTYRGVVDPSQALVAPNGTTAVTVSYLPVAPADGDVDSAPGLMAQFRATAGAPVSLAGLPFNDDFADFDVKGPQLADVIGTFDDPADHVRFRLVHGEGEVTQVAVKLECETPGDPLERAVVTDLDGDHFRTVLCGEERTVTLPDEGGSGTYKVTVLGVSEAYFTRYTLSIDAFCFQECQYQPAVP